MREIERNQNTPFPATPGTNRNWDLGKRPVEAENSAYSPSEYLLPRERTRSGAEYPRSQGRPSSMPDPSRRGRSPRTFAGPNRGRREYRKSPPRRQRSPVRESTRSRREYREDSARQGRIPSPPTRDRSRSPHSHRSEARAATSQEVQSLRDEVRELARMMRQRQGRPRERSVESQGSSRQRERPINDGRRDDPPRRENTGGNHDRQQVPNDGEPWRLTIKSPFAEGVLLVPVPKRFKIPTMEEYDGLGDPRDHLEVFTQKILIDPVSDPVICRAFPATLKGAALRWFSNLESGSISTFAQLSDLFLKRFSGGVAISKTSLSLMTIKQKEGEKLSKYMERFHRAMTEVHDLNEKLAMSALIRGIRHKELKYSIGKKAPRTYDEARARVRKFAEADAWEELEGFDSRKGKSPERRRASVTQ